LSFAVARRTTATLQKWRRNSPLEASNPPRKVARPATEPTWSQPAHALAGCGLVLDLDDCCLGDDGLTALASILLDSPIQELLLGENNFAAVGAEVVGTAVGRGPCRRLDLGFNMLGDEGVAALMRGFGDGGEGELRHLSLRDNEIYSGGARELAGGLGLACKRLVSLNLRLALFLLFYIHLRLFVFFSPASTSAGKTFCKTTASRFSASSSRSLGPSKPSISGRTHSTREVPYSCPMRVCY